MKPDRAIGLQLISNFDGQPARSRVLECAGPAIGYLRAINDKSEVPSRGEMNIGSAIDAHPDGAWIRVRRDLQIKLELPFSAVVGDIDAGIYLQRLHAG